MAEVTRSLSPRQVRRSRSGYVALRAVGASLAAAVVGFSALSMAPEMARQEQQSVTPFDAGQLETLAATGAVRVEGVTGDVRVREAAEGEQPSVGLDAEWAFAQPVLRLTPEEGRLVVSAPCTTSVLDRCRADLDLVVPAGTDLDIRSTFGDITLESTGEVTVNGTGGDVTLDGSSPRATVRTTFGDVQIGAAQAPDLVDVTTTFGNVWVTLPGTETYAVSAESTQGVTQVEVQQDPSAPHTVRVRSTFGALRVTP